MKHYIGTVLVFLGSLFAVSAQVITEQELNELLNSREIQMDNPIIQNLTVIRQVQDENQIISIQEQQGSASNHVLVNQNGTGNRGYIEQTGSGLETYLWQYNANNEANLWSVGENIHTSVKQDGDGNGINSYIKNYNLDQRSAMLLQEGNNNRIDLAIYGDDAPATGLTSQEFKITQQGNNHVVEAFMENDFRSMEINQNSGVDGDGMSIKVTQSYFNFPMKK
jgi:hypothetical protein